MTKKLTIDQMRQLAESRGGQCLSTEYVDNRTHLLWQCKEGHQWHAVPNHIVEGHWCPHCSGRAPLTIEQMRQLAKERGGQCISTDYVNSQTGLLWQCKDGHQWQAVPSSIINQGSWCPYCSGHAPHTIEEMCQLAGKRGGRCLSDKYTNAFTKLLWECEHGHHWWAQPGSILAGSWCPYCAGKARLTIEQMREIARKNDGKCLSETYINANTKLLWECSEGHRWDATPWHVKEGTWCPYCTNLTNEAITRCYMKAIFGASFPLSRPQWLVNDRGNQMSIDGYNEELGIAFEYNGKQHYHEVKYMEQGSHTLKRRKADDAFKHRLCQSHQVVLISVPYTVSRDKIGYDIVNKYAILTGKRVNLPPLNWHDFKIQMPRLQKLRDYAASQGGKCLAKNYEGMTYKVLWECKEGHQWWAVPSAVIAGHWCPGCARIRIKTGQIFHTIEEMQLIAEKKGGKCLSEQYVNVDAKLQWECKKGHRWSAKPDHIFDGHWCPHCAGNAKHTIGKFKIVAESRGGKCLSEQYKNVDTKLRWECKEGHQWEARPDHILAGHWCPRCSNRRKKSRTHT